jgi:PAS domain S-box-containing protein
MEARVALGVILLVTLSLAGALLAVTRVATRSAVSEASENLEQAQSAFYRLVDDRANFAARQIRLIIALPIFRSVMINPIVASDRATLTETADRYRRDLNAQFSIVTDPSGKPTVTPGWPVGLGLPPRLHATIHGASAGKSRSDIVPIQGKLFLVTSEPATFADAEVLGTVTFGFPLDDRVAKELAHIAHADINLISGNKLVGSSLTRSEQQDVSAALATGDLLRVRGMSSDVITLGNRRFIGGTVPLSRDRPSDDIGHLVLLEDWAPTQQFLDELQSSLLVAGIAGFVLALGGGLVFSRRTSQPLMDMAAAAMDISSGDWNRRVPVRGSAEATTLASAFNEMIASLRDQAERLNASCQRFSTVTQSARDAIISTDEASHITFWNRSAETTFGYAEGDVLGQPITVLIAESDRARYLDALPAPKEGDLTFGGMIEVTAVRKDGGNFPSEFSLAALHGPTGAAFTAIVRDVTERKQVQQALQSRDEQLRQAQKMEAIARLAGGIAHDFNNLLMAIRGYSEMLIQNLPDRDERRGDAEEILKAADRAAGLTRQLLAFSRRQLIAQQALALDEIVNGMQNMLQRLIGEDIQLVIRVWPDLAPVLADRTQVEQILVNLIVNARDAMPCHPGADAALGAPAPHPSADAALGAPASGGKITIELRNIELDNIGVAAHPGLQPGDYVEMAVRDTGIGMDRETASRIFEPFFTTKEGGKGTGLGLATVYGIVQQSGGAIEVQSTVDQGTTFFIYLPRATDLGKPAPSKAATSDSGSETILLVEDDDRVRALIASMLKQHGYSVLLASQGDQALEIAARHRGRIHLLVTDVVMPRISGRVLSERLTAARPDTQVLYMSGYSDDAILRHGVKSAATHFIQKPFSIDALAQKVRETLASPTNIPVKS